MPVVLAALVIVGMLCALNLILTLGVIKRLREHAALLAGGPPTIAVGEAIGEFSARTVQGGARWQGAGRRGRDRRARGIRRDDRRVG